MPVKPADVYNLIPLEKAVLYIKRGQNLKPTLYGYDLVKKKEITMLKGVHAVSLSADGKKLLWGMGKNFGIAEAKPAKINTKKGLVKTRGMTALKDIKTEWPQMLREAWRLTRDQFYVENMHGVDWSAMLKKYMPLVKFATHRRDLTYIMGEMTSELCTSHTYVGSPPLPAPKSAEIGLLGALLRPDKNGYFKIIKIYKGENWNPQGRSPLTEPGVKASEGNYLLEINGKPLRLPENPYHLLEKTLGTAVTLKLGKRPNDSKAWMVEIRPIRSESKLRYLNWVEENRVKVDKLTGGKVGYLHIPNMSYEGLNQFVKTWYSQIKKDGVIIDERYNGGGFVSQMILERLKRIAIGMRASRFRGTYPYPHASYPGHLVTLINHYAASDGDIFPYYFRKYGLGELIGTRTWGGVVGISGYQRLMDGGFVTVPTTGSYGLEGKWVMENVGTVPDINIDALPQDVAKGKDAQLQKAVEIIMKKIAEKPVGLPKQPPDPVKTK